MNYSLYEEEVNPGVGFNEDEYILRMPYIEIVGDNEARLDKVEITFLRKEEILNNFIELFDDIEGDLKYCGKLYECYELDEEDSPVKYTIIPIPEDNKIEMAFEFAANVGVYECIIYVADYHVNESKGEVLEELIEGSHKFFHEELMAIAEKHKGILEYNVASLTEE